MIFKSNLFRWLAFFPASILTAIVAQIVILLIFAVFGLMTYLLYKFIGGNEVFSVIAKFVLPAMSQLASSFAVVFFFIFGGSIIAPNGKTASIILSTIIVLLTILGFLYEILAGGKSFSSLTIYFISIPITLVAIYSANLPFKDK